MGGIPWHGWNFVSLVSGRSNSGDHTYVQTFVLIHIGTAGHMLLPKRSLPMMCLRSVMLMQYVAPAVKIQSECKQAARVLKFAEHSTILGAKNEKLLQNLQQHVLQLAGSM